MRRLHIIGNTLRGSSTFIQTTSPLPGIPVTLIGINSTSSGRKLWLIMHGRGFNVQHSYSISLKIMVLFSISMCCFTIWRILHSNIRRRISHLWINRCCLVLVWCLLHLYPSVVADGRFTTSTFLYFSLNCSARPCNMIFLYKLNFLSNSIF